MEERGLGSRWELGRFREAWDLPIQVKEGGEVEKSGLHSLHTNNLCANNLCVFMFSAWERERERVAYMWGHLGVTLMQHHIFTTVVRCWCVRVRVYMCACQLHFLDYFSIIPVHLWAPGRRSWWPCSLGGIMQGVECYL